MKKVRLTVNVLDDFELGDCYWCPFSEMDYDNDYTYCLFYEKDKCGLEIIEESDADMEN